MRTMTLGMVAVGLVGLLGCGEEPMTGTEARAAMDEAFTAERGLAPTAEPIEIATHFTIGGAVDTAADELRAWVESQIPCATATRDGNTLTLDFGDLADTCTYNGHTYAGVAAITIEKNDAAEVVVTHTWTGLTNGVVTVDGGATVTWSAADASRHVVHDLEWTDGARTVHATGDRTQTLIDPEAGLAGGIRIDGSRDWTADAGTWDLAIAGVEVRGVDPVPQAGGYTVTNPAGKAMSMAFSRIDDDTIEVTVTTGRWERVYEVSRDGGTVSEG